MAGVSRRAFAALWACFFASLTVGFIQPGVARAEDFDWRRLGGSTANNFVTPVQDQWYGTCWAFASTGAAEAKYKITRCDPTFQPNLSEEHLVWDSAGGGGMNGGSSSTALNFIRTNGVVFQGTGYGQIPHTGDTMRDDPPPNVSYWRPPADAARLTITANQYASTRDASGSVEAVKANIRNFGPIVLTITVDNDFYDYPNPVMNRGGHAVVLTGWHDNVDGENAPGGGYFYIKNSWGTGASGSDAGYHKISYQTIAGGKSTDLITGLAYVTAAMGTAAWQGGAGTWSTTNSTT